MPSTTALLKAAARYDQMGYSISDHDLMELLTDAESKPCGRGWVGTKPPGCKRSSNKSSTKTKNTSSRQQKKEASSSRQESSKTSQLDKSLETAKSFKAPASDLERVKKFVGKTVINDRGEKWAIDEWLPGLTKEDRRLGRNDFSVTIDNGRKTQVGTKQLDDWVKSGRFTLASN